MSRGPSLRCYVCSRPALPGDSRCRGCGFTLDWDAIGDLRSLDYLLLRIEQWERQGTIPPELAERLADEVERNHATLVGSLKAVVRPADRPAAAAVVPVPGPPPFTGFGKPPVIRPAEPHRLRPLYTLALDGAPVEISGRAARTDPGPLPFDGRPGVASAATSKKPILDVLVEFGTAKIALYVGSVLLALGVIFFLKDQLREQLSRPTVQAVLLGIGTLAALAGGVALVVRARERVEQRLIGRGVLFLGTLLLPVNPWFWLRTGLVHDRGNGWIATLATFAVALAIGLGLSDRVFIFMSYAAALATGWLLAFRVTGGASPGVYAVVLALVSTVYLHAELPSARRDATRGSDALGSSFFLAGHIGTALLLLFYTSLARFVPVELYAAFRYFDASGYSDWTAVGLALIAGEAYAFSAWRRSNRAYSFAASLSILWSVALALIAWDVRPGVWLAACGALALVGSVAARAIPERSLWGGPISVIARALAWLGVVATACVAVAMADGVEVRWFTTLGVALLLATFSGEAYVTRRAIEALPIPGLALVVAAYLLRLGELPWVFTDAVLAGLLAAVAMGTKLPDEDRGTFSDGIWASTTLLSVVLAFPALGFAASSSPSLAHRAVPFALALGVALAASGFRSPFRALRIPLYAAAGILVEAAALLGAAAAKSKFQINERYSAFLLAPVAVLFLLSWLALRRSEIVRRSDGAHVSRVWSGIATAVAAFYALPVFVDGLFDHRGYLAFAAEMGVLCAIPLAAAFVDRISIPAYVEGAYGLLLGLAAWAGLTGDLVGRLPSDRQMLASCLMLGLAPLVLAALDRGLTSRAPAVARPATAIGGVVAVALVAVLVPIVTPWFSGSSWSSSDRLGMIGLALCLTAYGMWCIWRSSWSPLVLLWTVYTTVTASLAVHGTLRTIPANGYTAIALAALGGLLLSAGLRARGSFSRLRGVLVAMGHATVAIAVLDGLAAQPWSGPVSWTFVAACSVAAVAYLVAAAASEPASASEGIHRMLAYAAGLATAPVALHAAGLTSVHAQAVWLALILTAAMAACVVVRTDWSRRDGVAISHVAMGVLLLGVAVTALDSDAWTSLDVTRFSSVITAFYGFAATRRSAASLGASLAALSGSVLAFCAYLHLSSATQIIVFAALAAVLSVMPGRIPAEAAWARQTLLVATHSLFVLAASFELAFVVPELSLGNPSLGKHIAALGALTAATFLARRSLPPPASTVYGVAWRGLALATYWVLGVRLGYHPWRESAFYTLPVGAFLVLAGTVSSRRRDDTPESAALLWLGSFLAGVPPLLHALDNRFILNISPIQYDMLDDRNRVDARDDWGAVPASRALRDRRNGPCCRPFRRDIHTRRLESHVAFIARRIRGSVSFRRELADSVPP